MTLEELLQASAERHHHLCPRQVLGIRMGLLAGRMLGIPVPQRDKRLLVFVETDGCAADAISVGTGCWVGRRTMRVLDYGKVAATFLDTATQQAVRLVPKAGIRELATAYAPEASTRWHAQLLGYQRMPEADLLVSRAVALCVPLDELMGKDGVRVTCKRCGEEILNRREIVKQGRVFCRSCAGDEYYTLLASELG